MKNKRLLMAAGLLVVFIGLPAFLAWNLLLGPVMEMRAHYRDLIGKPEEQVVKVLGKPRFRVAAEEASKHGIDFAWRERNFQPVPDRPVHKEVLLYEASDASLDKQPFAVYVFIGADGRVEAIDFAGS